MPITPVMAKTVAYFAAVQKNDFLLSLIALT
jgi:hypothetical protein